MLTHLVHVTEFISRKRIPCKLIFGFKPNYTQMKWSTKNKRQKTTRHHEGYRAIRSKITPDLSFPFIAPNDGVQLR